MHKRKLDFNRLLPLVLLTTLLFPTIANASGPSGMFGKEQQPAFDRLDDPPTSSDIRGFGYLYTVEPGDDVWLLAVSHGLTQEALAQVNNLTPPYWIYPGDKLWIPAAPAVIKRAPTPTPTPIATPTPLPTPAATPAPASEPLPSQANDAGQTEADQAPIDEQNELPPVGDEGAGDIVVNEAIVVTEAAAASAVRSAGIDAEAQLMMNLMNEKRTARGLPALTWSSQLATAAQAHADDCARRGWGSHVGSDGARLRTRLARVGYYPSWTSENWANSVNVQSAFNMWYWEGPGGPHYENIMSRNYTEAGIGIAQSGWGYYYIVDFGKP